MVLEKAPGQQRREAVKHTGGQVEDGAQAGLQRSGTTSVDHDHLVDLVGILVGQEGTDRHTARAEERLFLFLVVVACHFDCSYVERVWM